MALQLPSAKRKLRTGAGRMDLSQSKGYIKRLQTMSLPPPEAPSVQHHSGSNLPVQIASKVKLQEQLTLGPLLLSNKSRSSFNGFRKHQFSK
jgi:hypothetical protein